MSDLQYLVDKDAIIDRVNELFIATDEKAWDRVRASFTPQVHFDMSSLGAGEAKTVAPEIFVAGWEEALEPIEALHHQIGNYRVTIEEDKAQVFCYGIATHYKDKKIQSFVGTYDIGLSRHDAKWLIDAFRFNAKYVT